MVTPDGIVTPGDIARELGEAWHRVAYVLKRRPHIRPLRRVGAVCAYAPEAVALVRAELAAIDARRPATRSIAERTKSAPKSGRAEEAMRRTESAPQHDTAAIDRTLATNLEFC